MLVEYVRDTPSPMLTVKPVKSPETSYVYVTLRPDR
jgi:hypothetical protein